MRNLEEHVLGPSLKAPMGFTYLSSMESTAQGESEPYFIPQDDQQVINLEHILPKKPEGNWPDWNEEDVRHYTTRLGNQALLRMSDNSKLKSDTFAQKKVVYADFPYELTNQVGVLDKESAQLRSPADARELVIANF